MKNVIGYDELKVGSYIKHTVTRENIRIQIGIITKINKKYGDKYISWDVIWDSTNNKSGNGVNIKNNSNFEKGIYKIELITREEAMIEVI